MAMVDVPPPTKTPKDPENSQNYALEADYVRLDEHRQNRHAEGDSIREEAEPKFATSMEHESGKREGAVEVSNLRLDVEGETTATSEPFEEDELALIESALRILQQRNQLVVTNDEGDNMGREIAQLTPSSCNHLRDADGIERLVKKVKAVRTQARETLSKGERSRSGQTKNHRNLGTSGRSEGEVTDPADICEALQAVSKAALSAGKAAETVLSTMNRNSHALEELGKALTDSSSHQISMDGTGKHSEGGGESGAKLGEEDEMKIHDIEMRQVEIANNLVRQNRITHWVLGVMLVSSIVWRLGVIKFVQNINYNIQNPFQSIMSVFRGSSGQKPGQQDQKAPNVPKFKLPSILNGDESENVELTPDKSHRRSSQEKEDVGFKLGSILPRIEQDPKS